MFTRKLALSVATAALLTASALPAMAVPGDFRFFFEQTLPSTFTGNATPGANLVSGYFTTGDKSPATPGSGNVTGFVGTIGGNSVTTASLSGSYLTTASGVAQLQGLSWIISGISGGGYTNLPWFMSVGNYLNDSSITPTVSWSNIGGGNYSATNIVQPLLMPEINGGALPKGLFVIGGVFLMLFGRNKLNEA